MQLLLLFKVDEQINKDTGLAQGARDLTWSYGTVIGAMKARADLLKLAEWVASKQ